MRTLLGLILVLLLLAGAGFLLFGYRGGSPTRSSGPESAQPAVGTSGADVERARERGAEIGEKVAVASRAVENTIDEAALTTKIKAKMALDDTVKAREINVTTNGSTVTLSGEIRSETERERAVSLARETAGVSRVVDHLQLRK